jgi:hypothetical protein
MIDKNRLSTWAAAQAIYAFGEKLFAKHFSECFRPTLLPNHKVLLGNSVVFTDKQFIQLIERRFGFPSLTSCLLFPWQTVQVLYGLRQIGLRFNSHACVSDAPKLLYASLKAICVYLNNHEHASKVFSDEINGSLLVRVRDKGKGFYIFNHHEFGWTVSSASTNTFSSATLEFQNEDVSIQASLGLIDSWAGITGGNIHLSGRIPMLDKFGYVARIVQRELPRPI